MNKNYIYIGGGVVIAVAVLLAAWYLFFSGTPVTAPVGINTPFGTSDTRTSVTPSNTPATTNQQTTIEYAGSTNQKIFKISAGPVAGATLIDASRPTTTVARFVMADSGHIFDLPLDSPGAAQKPVSNTTIPGIVHVVWSEAGRGALLQYVDGSTLKTAHFALPSIASSTGAVKVQFLQNNIASLAVSPDGANTAFLIKTSSGADGYTARADGGGIKKLFSLPFSQMSLSWPAASTLLAVSAPAAGISGGAFAIDAKTGTVATLLFADGLSAVADKTFSRVVYQTEGDTRATYVLNTKTGVSVPLGFDPLPEQCLFGALSGLIYCAAPLSATPTNYLDLWHQGAASAPESILGFDLAHNTSHILAVPGGATGGEQSDIAEMAVSASDNYIVFIRRGDRSLWGVRLGN